MKYSFSRKRATWLVGMTASLVMLAGCAALFGSSGSSGILSSGWDDKWTDHTTSKECRSGMVMLDSTLEVITHHNRGDKVGLMLRARFDLCGPAQADNQVVLSLRKEGGSEVLAEQVCVVGKKIPGGAERGNPSSVECEFQQTEPPITEAGLYSLDIGVKSGGQLRKLRTAWLKVGWAMSGRVNRPLIMRKDYLLDEAWLFPGDAEFAQINFWVMPSKDVDVAYRWFHNGQPWDDSHMIRNISGCSNNEEPTKIEANRPSPKMSEICSKDGTWSMQVTFNGELAKVFSFKANKGRIVAQPVQAAGASNRLRAGALLVQVERKSDFEKPTLTPEEMEALHFNGVLADQPPPVVAESYPYMRTTFQFTTVTMSTQSAESVGKVVVPAGTTVRSETIKGTDGDLIHFRTDKELVIQLNGKSGRSTGEVSATAEIPGTYVIPAGDISKLSSSVAYITKAVNTTPAVLGQK